MAAAFPLQAKRILITGAAQGIGAAVARRCADDGAHVALVDIDARVREVADTLGARSFVGDVTDASFATTTVEEATTDLGGLDGLANVAGIQRSGDILELRREDWDLVLGVNLTAPFLWSRAVVPVMLEQGRGRIVNIASVAATHAIRNSLASVASKHALLGLTRSVSTDFGERGIRCNAVSPGSIETELLATYMAENPQAGRRLIDANFTGRLGRPEEVAACCAHLFADDADFLNGANIVVDGGRTAAT